MFRLFKLLYLVTCFLIVFKPISARCEDNHKVLILHSYEQGDGWTDKIMDGMMSVLKSADVEINIYTEYLDAQRIPKDRFWPVFETYLSTKYHNEKFDVILASDDDILDFLLPRYKNLFPDTPFVFCGINNLDENKFKEHNAFKGINQEVDAKETIQLALKLLPHTEKFLVISDRTSGGIKTSAKLKEDIANLGLSEQKFQLIDNYTVTELKRQLQALGKNDVVLVLRIQKIKGIEERLPEKFASIVTDTASVPVFNLWDSGKNDFIGGVCVSPFAQGKTAADIALKILKGENLQNVPQVTQSPNVSKLNYLVLKKFKIKEKNIPQGTTVINLPTPTMEKYRQQIRLALIISVTLLLIIISLITVIFYRRKSEKLILKSEQRFKAIFENAPVLIDAFDDNGHCVLWNNECEKTFGWTIEEINAHGEAMSLFYPDPAIRAEVIRSITTNPDIQFREWHPITKDGKKLDTMWANIRLPEGLTFSLGYDITERNKAEKQITASLKEKETLLHEIHHRVKNNMQIIASLLNLQLHRTDKQDIESFVKECKGRIYAMAGIHECLHKSENLFEIDFKDYVLELSHKLIRTYAIDSTKVNFEISAPKLRLGIDKANPLGLVLNELVSNSLKYAFPDDRIGIISIQAELQENNSVVLIVSDDGVGMPDGIDWRKASTLGLHLVKDLVENQLEGSIECEVYNGTKFIIKFNLESGYKLLTSSEKLILATK